MIHRVSDDRTSDRLSTVEHGTSAWAVERLLTVLFPDARTALDMTYGSGKFWDGTAGVEVVGMDRNPLRARHVCADFTRLPFSAGAFDVAIFDPPYITDAGRDSVMRARFGSFRREAELRAAVEQGSREAWRASRLGVIVKVQNHKHASRFVHMTRWVEDALAPAELYDEMHVRSGRKIEDGRWRDQLSLRSAHATYMVFRHDGPIHRRRVARQLGRRYIGLELSDRYADASEALLAREDRPLLNAAPLPVEQQHDLF